VEHLRTWFQPDGLYTLWKTFLYDLHVSKSIGGPQNMLYNVSQALFWAREGRYNNAVQLLTFSGVADKNDDSAFKSCLNVTQLLILPPFLLQSQLL